MTPQVIVTSYLKRRLRDDARVAALILRAWPEFIVDRGLGGNPAETVESYLRRMGAGTIRHETVLRLEGALNGSRLMSGLDVEERAGLATRLERFARELS